MTVALAKSFNPDTDCGGEKRQGGGPCTQRKGWGTPHPGSGKCKLHGGSTETGTKAAKREEVEVKAQRMVELAGVDQDPFEHLLETLYRAAALERVWGQMVGELDELAEEENADSRSRGELGYEMDTDEKSPYELLVRAKDRLLALDRHGQAGVHPFVTKLEEAIDRRAKVAKMCVDAGVAERQVRLAEGQAHLLATAIKGIIIDLGHDPGSDEVRKVIAKHLRALG